MDEVKEMNIKDRTYYFFDDMVDIRNFQPNLLKIDKKPYKDIDIYYIGYITIKKNGDYENIRSVNPSYLIINSIAGDLKKNGKKYLIISMPENYEEVFSEILSEIIIINGKKEKPFYEKNYARIKVDTDDDIPLNVPLKFPTLTIIIRCVFQVGTKFYPQIYLDECLYELQKNVGI